ncbi:MAG: RNA methyltransferase [Christensenellaceae bacterium]|jgi:TrmH family RNA methyltransferase|nr:RNA methyltransferase [Christensenellaceae bacterium]
MLCDNLISSIKNSKVSLLRSLSEKENRDALGLYLAEGFNLIKDLKNTELATDVFIRESEKEKFCPILEKKYKITLLSSEVFSRVSSTENSTGVISIVKKADPKPLSGSIVVVLDGIRDPGNMGTIIRTAVAVGILDIVAIDSVDFYNNKTVRASMGGIFYINPVVIDRSNLSSYLNGYDIAILDMNGSNIYDFNPPEKLVIVVGSEAHGISNEFKNLAKHSISIPMYNNNIESLNAAVSMSIALSQIKNAFKSH